MTRIYKTPFATSSDKLETLADTEQPDGKVSLPTGWTSVYELENSNPGYKPVGRGEMNGVFNEITSAIGELQLQGGIIRWRAIDGGYNKGAVVYSSNMQTMWQSTADANTTDPDSATSKGWKNLNSVNNDVYDIFIGMTSFFCMQTAPKGWLFANGSAVSRTTYAKLFSKIGTHYGGGDGRTTFTLPDLRGEFLRGWDAGRGIDGGRNIGTYQGDAIRNISGWFNASGPWSNGVAGGSFYTNGSVAGNTPGGNNSSQGAQTSYVFNAANVVPTANENRPRNISLAVYIYAGV